MIKAKTKANMLTQKEAESLKLKEKICDTLAEKEPHEFRVPYTRTVSGYASIIAMDMDEAKAKLDDDNIEDYEDDSYESEYEFGDIQDTEE